MKKIAILVFLLVSFGWGAGDHNVTTIIKIIEKKEFDNRLSPSKDIDFLYRNIIGGDYFFQTNQPILDNKVIGIRETWWPWDDDELVFEKKFTIDDFHPTIEYKMRAVEEQLGIKTDTDSDLIERIGNAYEKNNYADWNKDRLRFAILTNYLQNSPGVVTSASILVFPSYRKYIPGDLALLNRYGFVFGIGTYESFEKKYEVDGSVYSFGINIEIQNGFGINVSYNGYSGRDNPDEEFKFNQSISYGVTLSSDLWKSIFGFDE